MSARTHYDGRMALRGAVPRQLGRAGVTRREAEVLAAVAGRLRNREIAERLHVSIRTVESHVAALLRKLEVADRAALVALGVQVARMAAAGTLPVPLTSFVGRQQESAEVTALLDKHRLVTLIGPAGVGKTRLGLQQAARAVLRFPDGARLADLTPVGAALVGDTLARALGVIPQPGRPLRDSLREVAGEARCLLLVDNCEHVITEAAALVGELLTAGQQLQVLATSREPLGVPGEVSYQLQPLPVPPPGASPGAAGAGGYDGVRLFVERATAAWPGFALTDTNAAGVATLCQRLDGLPLATELAAAQVRSFSPAELAAHLDRRFELLAGGARTAQPRHRTLRAAIDWSYQLLDEDERMLFDQLGVFPADFDYQAAQAVCATGAGEALLRLLPALVNKSLVSATGGDGARRYRLLESLRAYAAARLAARGADPVRQRHAGHYLRLAEQAAGGMRGPAQASWLARLDQEHDHIRAALAWSLERSQVESGLRLALAVWWFWQVRGFFQEGRHWLEQLLAGAPSVPVAMRMRALRAIGILAVRQGDYRPATAALEECLQLARRLADRQQASGALTGLGMIAWRCGDFGRADELWAECLALSRELDDPLLIANSLNNLALVAREQGNYPQAAELGHESVAHYRAQHDAQGLAMAVGNLGQVSAEQDDYPDAAARYAESLALHETLADGRSLAIELARQGSLEAVLGHYHTADHLLERSLAAARRVGDRQRVAYAYCGQAELDYLRGHSQRAIVRYDTARVAFTELGERPGLAATALGTALAMVALDDAEPAATWAAESLRRCRRLGHRKGVAWSLHALARASRLRGEMAQAEGLDRRAITVFYQLGSRRGAACCLDGLAQHAAATNDPARSVLLLGAASGLRQAIGIPVPLVDRPGRDAQVAALRAELGDEAFTAAWSQGRAVDLARAVELAR
jgi:predicted ATPase/DNA-binding CsgD family transcriptional regulator